MKEVKVINTTRNTVLAEKAKVANSFLTRLVGLLGQKVLPPGQGLILEPCSSVHTFFMAFPIDIVFLDNENRVLIGVDCLKPWKMSPYVKGARKVVELPAGVLGASGTLVGDLLSIK